MSILTKKKLFCLTFRCYVSKHKPLALCSIYFVTHSVGIGVFPTRKQHIYYSTFLLLETSTFYGNFFQIQHEPISFCHVDFFFMSPAGSDVFLPEVLFSTYVTIMCRNDELSWLFTKRFRAFYLICRKQPNPSQNFWQQFICQ